MIYLKEAIGIVEKEAKKLSGERIFFTEALGRVLAEDVCADLNMPPFDKSAMDGFACKRADLDAPLKIIETIAAGSLPKKKINQGECAKIMTGAMIPTGADCVVMVEHTLEENGFINITKQNLNDNICYVGEDIKVDDVVLTKGTVIEPQHVAVLATVGCVNPFVVKQAKVGIISTGSELVEPTEKPVASQIRNSNGYQLMAQVTKIGATAKYYGIVEDDYSKTKEIIKRGLEENDILLLTGGVSMGEFDFVPAIFQELELNILFSKIAVQPGRPTVFGKKEKTVCFGLPGNPVSSFVIFELLVKPYILKLQGAEQKLVAIRLPLEMDIKRKKSDREAWFPVMINKNGRIEKMTYNGSAHINSLADANGLASFPIGVNELKAGDFVYVRFI